jgi:hypothetical protein
MRYTTYGSPDHGGYGYETPPQFLFKPHPVEMMPTRATTEPYVDPNNPMTQLLLLWESLLV